MLEIDQVSKQIQFNGKRCNALELCQLRACPHGSEGPCAGDIPCLGGITNLSIQSLFFINLIISHIRQGTPSGLGNPLQWSEFSHVKDELL